jgi:hypothetical protein
MGRQILIQAMASAKRHPALASRSNRVNSTGVKALTSAAFVKIVGAGADGAWASAVSGCAQKAGSMQAAC